MDRNELQRAVEVLMTMDNCVFWLETNLPAEYQKQVTTLAKKVAALQGTMNHKLQYIIEE